MSSPRCWPTSPRTSVCSATTWYAYSPNAIAAW